MPLSFHNKRVLLFGLGLLGGGVATANWLTRQGAILMIADAKTAEELALSLAELEGSPRLNLGGNTIDIGAYDVIVLNPGVSSKHPIVAQARSQGIPVLNEAVIFYHLFPGRIIGITGTRGKTTTATWTHHLIAGSILAGNSPDHPFLEANKLKAKSSSWAVTEVSSFHLELFDESVRPPDIAVITNIYRDHLNRYDSFGEYAETKKNLYRWQKPGQILLSATEEVPLDLKIIEKEWGAHNVANFHLAALAAHHAGVSWETIEARIDTLPHIPFRQEIIFKNENLTIINDTAATSPEGGIAAIERFGGPDTVLIAGGTDAELDFTGWNEVVAQKIPKDHRVFLAGSATKKMLDGNAFETLEACVAQGLALKPKILLFSPACKSFEKFANEYDRGKQFNKLAKDAIKKLNGGVA